MLIQEEAHEDANIIFGAVIDENLKEEMRITVIATGFGRADSREESIPEAVPASPEREKTVVNFSRKEENRDIPAFLRTEKTSEIQERIAKTVRDGFPRTWWEKTSTTSPPSCESRRTD